jgi:hypothetical protein
MATLLVISVLALWAAGVVAAVSLCLVAGKADRDDLARARGIVPLRLISNS